VSPEIQHHFGGGVYAKETRIPAGYILVQHKHEFDHLSVVGSGIVQVTVDGKTSTVVAPACLLIKAHTEHRVQAVTDSVWYCIHATDCTDPAKVDELLIERG
jgi:quercetin dioxygenase-like cupin family protein